MSEVGSANIDDRSQTIPRHAAVFSWMLFVLSALLIFAFALPDIQDGITSFIGTVRPERIRYFTLFGYLVSWLVAMYVDLQLQKYVYRGDPGQGAPPRQGLWVAVGLFIPALILIWSRDNEARLAVVLNLFLLVNICAWRFAAKYALRFIASSQKYYEGSPEGELGIARLRIVSSYIGGPWQWRRFLVMLLIISMTDVISFSAGVRAGTSAFVHNAIPSVSADRISGLLPDIAIFFFIMVAETWSWTKRISTVATIRKLEVRTAFDQPHIAEYMTQFFDQQFKAVNYLMIAHGAAFVTTLTLLKDYVPLLKNTDKGGVASLINIQGLRSLTALFAWGLVFAVLGYIMLTVAKDSVMGVVLLNLKRSAYEKSSYLAWGFCAGSALLLLLGILSVASRLNSLGIFAG